jgi:hypothetical protein
MCQEENAGEIVTEAIGGEYSRRTLEQKPASMEMTSGAI